MTAVLSLGGVSLSYPRGRRHVVRVLSDISLDLAAGEIVAVRGQRAQGKTSLLRVAAGMEPPGRGKVLFDGEDVWAMSDRRRSRLLRGEIAFVQRAAPQLDLPVLSGVALPLLDAHGRRGAYALARQALARVGAAECASQHWDELADWERALVALAQGFAREPRLLLVDDVAATLGIGESDFLAGQLRDFAEERGSAVLICAGDAGVTACADRLAWLRDGSLLVPAHADGEEVGNIIEFPGERPRRASS